VRNVVWLAAVAVVCYQTPRTMAEAPPGNIVKEGWLQKRGEHIRNWRDRYFILFDNGDLVGFKTQPERNNYRDPLNKFTVRDCQIMAVDKPRPYTFTIRGLQWTTVIERNFSVDTEKERSVLHITLYHYLTPLWLFSFALKSTGGLVDHARSPL
jgi:hypothetical protein